MLQAKRLTIADYSTYSKNERLYVIDVLNGRRLLKTFVSHGTISGEEFATSVSNLNNSNKSSLGFMITAETYSGKAGFSMRFNGMEKGINDHVRLRDIVLHGSGFVNENVMSIKGIMGKSLCCPAVPSSIQNRFTDVIKGGSTFFSYHPDEMYSRISPVLNSRFDINPMATQVVDSGNEAQQAQALHAAADVIK